MTSPSQPDPQGGDLGARIGRAVKSTRIAIDWSQRELARRLGTNQAAIQRLEAGRQRHLDVGLATAAAEALGIRIMIDASPIGLRGRREQRDFVHARCMSCVAGQLRRRGWQVRTEVEIGTGRFRGWIDIVAYRPSDRALLVIEVKTEIDDLGRISRSLFWYARASREAAAAFGWRPNRVVPILVALATIETDARLTAVADLVMSDLPGDADSLAAWIDDPSARPPEPTAALIDPLSRRRTWLWRTRSAGRRSPAPYRDYRDIASRLAAAG